MSRRLGGFPMRSGRPNTPQEIVAELERLPRGPAVRAVLTDFGIAALQGSTALTATGELIGSPEYTAPERIRGNDDDPASDLWSLGLVLYVCVEGVSPLRRGTSARESTKPSVSYGLSTHMKHFDGWCHVEYRYPP